MLHPSYTAQLLASVNGLGVPGPRGVSTIEAPLLFLITFKKVVVGQDFVFFYPSKSKG